MSGSFVKSDQVITDLLDTLSKSNNTSQMLKEALLRESNCDYKAQLITGLGVGSGPLHNAILGIAGERTPTLLPPAVRYYANQMDQDQNSSRMNLIFANGPESVYTFPMQVADTRDIVTSVESLQPTYSINNNNEVVFDQPGTWLLNVKASLIVWNGQTRPGVGHPAPTFLNGNDDIDLSNGNIYGSYFNIRAVIGDGYLDQQIVLTDGWFYRNNVKNFDVFHVHGSLVFTAMANGLGIENVQRLRIEITTGSPFVSFGGVSQRLGMFKQIPADSPKIDSSNFVELISLGDARSWEG